MQNNQVFADEPRATLSSTDIPDTTASALAIASPHFPVGIADGVETLGGVEVGMGLVAVMFLVGLVSFRAHNPR